MNKPLASTIADAARIPYQKPQPRDMPPDMVIPDAMSQSDPRVWVPLSEHVFARHRHAGVVHAWVIKGRWLYLEHEKARAHYAAVGLGEDYVEQFIR